MEENKDWLWENKQEKVKLDKYIQQHQIQLRKAKQYNYIKMLKQYPIARKVLRTELPKFMATQRNNTNHNHDKLKSGKHKNIM